MSAHYFVSDAHLGAAPPGAEARLARFLNGLEGRADSLWILGDLFDFWFEYGRVIPRHGFRILAALARLREAGIRVSYLAGNHDLRFGGFLRRELGIETGAGGDIELDGRKVLVRHGDEIDRRAVSRLFRVLMRSRLNNGLYRLIHPDLGIALAGWVARRSRARGPDERLAGAMREWARARLAEGRDLVVLGHLHRPELTAFPGGGSYLNAGDWIENFSYGILRDGRPALERFDG
ncbi:MAG: UDP-2,3-diacylglucosamine diphosphatase [bacterium]